MTERIDVYYSRISLPKFIEDVRGPAYHEHLVHTDKSGEQYILRAGPDHYGPAGDAVSPPTNPHMESSYGPVRFLDRQFDDLSPEYRDHKSSLGELL